MWEMRKVSENLKMFTYVILVNKNVNIQGYSKWLSGF